MHNCRIIPPFHSLSESSSFLMQYLKLDIFHASVLWQLISLMVGSRFWHYHFSLSLSMGNQKFTYLYILLAALLSCLNQISRIKSLPSLCAARYLNWSLQTLLNIRMNISMWMLIKIACNSDTVYLHTWTVVVLRKQCELKYLLFS